MTNYPDLELAQKEQKEQAQPEESRSSNMKFAPLDPFAAPSTTSSSNLVAKTLVGEDESSISESEKITNNQFSAVESQLCANVNNGRGNKLAYVDELADDMPFLIVEKETSQLYMRENSFASEEYTSGRSAGESNSTITADVAGLAVDNRDFSIPVCTEQSVAKTAKKSFLNPQKHQQKQLEDLVRSVREHKVVSVFSAAGASGATTLTFALASVYSEIRNEQSVAIDLVKEGNLGLLAGNKGNMDSRWYKDIFELAQLEKWEYKHNVHTALYHNPNLGYGSVAVSPSHDFRVASHFGKKLRSVPLTAHEYEKINLMLNHYDAVFNDFGPDVTAPALIGYDPKIGKIGALSKTTNLVLVTKPNFASVEAGLRKLAAIKANGYSDLVRRCLVVINCCTKSNKTQIESTTAAFSSITRAVEVIPYDKVFTKDSLVDPLALRNKTYQALISVASKLSY